MGGDRWLQETPRKECSFFVTDRQTMHHNIYIINIIVMSSTMYLLPSSFQGLVAFGQDVLKATALNQAIKDMHAAKKYLSLRLIMLLISNHNNYCDEITMQYLLSRSIVL